MRYSTHTSSLCVWGGDESKQSQPATITYLRSVVVNARGGFAGIRWWYIYYNSGWWNTWSVEATKTVAKYERVGEPQRMRLLNHMSNAHCALPPCAWTTV